VKVIYNLLNSIASFDDGRIRLQPRGTPDDHKAITDAQAQLPQVVKAVIGNRVRLVSVAENVTGDQVTPKKAVATPVPPKATPKPVVEDRPPQEDATPVLLVSEKLAATFAVEAVVDDAADASDEHATESTEKDSADRKHGKKPRRR